MRDANQLPDESRISRGHIDIPHWVRKVNLQLILTVSVDRPAVGGKVISISGQLLTVQCRRFGTERTPADETVLDDDKNGRRNGVWPNFADDISLMTSNFR